jgi:dTDP-4-dehydrorhamnose 3,5-epimerase
MEFKPLGITGAWLATSNVWHDERGYFREWFKSTEVSNATGLNFNVSQANISVSARGVVRGMHYSLAIGGQAKWVTCVSGAIMDVIVDIRTGSATYGSHVKVDLKAGDGQAVLIGGDLAHGFVSLEDRTAVSYLLSSPYSPKDEYEINPLDPTLDIDWRLNLLGESGVVLSPKDSTAATLDERKRSQLLPTYRFSD